jgi:hypothetical protein
MTRFPYGGSYANKEDMPTHLRRHWETQERLNEPKATETRAHLYDAKANLMREQRLSDKAEHLSAIGHEAAKLESGRTQEALGKLGAGKGYGEA